MLLRFYAADRTSPSRPNRKDQLCVRVRVAARTGGATSQGKRPNRRSVSGNFASHGAGSTCYGPKTQPQLNATDPGDRRDYAAKSADFASAVAMEAGSGSRGGASGLALHQAALP